MNTVPETLKPNEQPVQEMKTFHPPFNTQNKYYALLRHIYPKAPRKELRKLMKNKAFMASLNITES